MQAEIGTSLQSFGVVQDALHRGRAGGQLTRLVEQHVRVTDGDDKRVADVVDHLGGGLAVTDLHLVFLLLQLHRLIHSLEVLEQCGALLAFQGLAGVAAHRLLQHVDVERLLEILVGAEAHRHLRRGERPVAGHHNNRGVGVDLAQFLQALDAVFLRHADIHDHHGEGFAANQLEAAVHAVGGLHVEFILQQVAHAFPRAQFVINDEHLGARRGRGG